MKEASNSYFKSQCGGLLPILISVTLRRFVLGALVAARADQAFRIGLHQQVKDGFCDGAQEIALIVLLQELNNINIGLGHRGLRVVRG